MSKNKPKITWVGNIKAQEEADAAFKKFKQKAKKRKKINKKLKVYTKKFGKIKKQTLNKEYKDYINSPEWKNKRKQKLSEINYCEKCKSKKYLHVHHKHYKTFKQEQMSDLMVLCELCHKTLHISKDLKIKQHYVKTFFKNNN